MNPLQWTVVKRLPQGYTLGLCRVDHAAHRRLEILNPSPIRPAPKEGEDEERNGQPGEEMEHGKTRM